MRHLTHYIIVGLMGALMSCSGEQGEAGPAGTPGTPGTPGTGTPGVAGAPALTKVSDAPADKCADGGKMVEAGVDKNANGTLDADEVTSTSYICNGAGGKPSLVKTSPEAAGANCPFGGTKIETGLDKNANGTLDADEVVAASTSYACAVAPSGTISPSKGLVIGMKTGAVSTATTGPITIRFTLKDDRGFPVDVAGKYSQNTVIQPRFALAYFTKSATGIVSPLKVYTKSGTSLAPTAFNPASTGQGKLTENGVGAGDYTYEFPTTATTGGAAAVAYDATKLGETHVAWIQASRQTDEVYTSNANTFFTANQDYYYIPSGTGTPLKRELVTQANCNKCHDNFKPESTSSAEFHGGGRISALYCNVCHNPDRTSNPAADSAVFVHRIHYGHKLPKADLFHELEATYPQDIRACGSCHKGAAQEAQVSTNITRAVCKSCHSNVDFVGTSVPDCVKPPAVDAEGRLVACKHKLGPQSDDTGCANTACHGGTKLADQHKPIVPPNPGNSWATGSLGTGGAAGRLNAANLAAAGYVPTGANVITYDVKSVDTVVDAADTAIRHPRITFKLKKDGTDVVFQTYAAGTTTEMMPNFFGAPSAYFAWAVPQDGIAKPVDFNASASVYLRSVWNGTVTSTNATLSAPDSTGYYTLTLLSAKVTADAVMLTGGLGYTYSIGTSLTAADTTVPLTQTNVPGFSVSTDGKNQGGLIVPIPNVWKTATPALSSSAPTGWAARRPIVENAKCNNCHAGLGVAPTFHVGQRNDGPTCSFCHTANRPSSGWSAGSKYAIHALHAGRKRSVPYTWYAASATENFGEIGFPSALNKCTNCHAPNTYDFTASTNLASLPNQLFATVATGLIDPASATYYRYSPYVSSGTNYGTGFTFNSGTLAKAEAAPTTLVISPITTACSSCHDSPTAIDHMKMNGGHFYEPRSTALTGPKEQCMMCHGPGRVAAIGDVHQR